MMMSFELTHIPSICEANARETERRLRVLLEAAEEAFDLIDGVPCPIDSAEEWKRQVRAKLLAALRTAERGE
jgi:hypothetical protein